MRVEFLLSLFLMAAASGSAATIFDNGAADNQNGFGMFNTARGADDFSLSAASTVQALGFYWTTGPGQNPTASLGGTITYGLYQDSGGSLGSLVASGTVSGIGFSLTGVVNGCGTCQVAYSEFNLASAVNLAAGTYWLELHKGASFTATSSPALFWATSAQTGNAKHDINALPATSVNSELAFALFDAPVGVPEPGTIGLAAAALALVAVRRRR